MAVGCGLLIAFVLTCVALLGMASAAEAAPANDDFDDATPIRVGQTIRGTINGATVQRGETGYKSPQARSVWYRFRVKREVMVDVSLCGTTFSSEIDVYVGRSLGSLRRVRWTDNVCDRGFGSAFRARPGRSYAIAVYGFSTPSWRIRNGSFRLRVRSLATPPNDDFADAMPLRLGSTISGATAGATGERGEPRPCCGILHTVWYRLRVATPRQVRLDACRGNTRIAVYTGDHVNRLIGVADLGHCDVQFAAQPGVSYRVVVDDQGRWGRFRLSARTATPPPNDDFANATPITLGSRTSGTTRHATLEAGEPRYGGSYPFTVWYRLTVLATTEIQLGVCPPGEVLGVGYAPTIDVYTGDQVSQLQHIAGNNCQDRFVAPPGVYSIRAADSIGEDGSFVLSAQAVAPM